MVGRPKKTVDTPLTLQEEMYVQAIVNGSSKRHALIAAGFRIPANWAPKQVANKGLNIEKRPNVRAKLRELGLESAGPGRKPMPDAPPDLESYEPENITPAWVNQQAQYVFHQALASADFGASLKTLSFMAEFNGLVAKRRQGRPAVVVNPNQGDVSGNYGDTDQPTAPTGAGFDSFFGDADTSDGDSDPEGDDPFFRASTPSKPVAEQAGRERSASPANRPTARAGKPRANLSGGPTGE
ncbi:MAG: hypothetical protein ACXW13_00095 [Burkholderiaceae bacterium]